MTAIAAFASGALIGSAIFSPRRYRFWWKWSHGVFAGSLVVILAINGAFGIIGIGIAHAFSWHPWQQSWANGVSFALLGLAVVRVRLPGVDVDEPESSVHALNIIMRWTIALLDDVADNQIRKSLATLRDSEMRELVAYLLAAEVIPDEHLDSQDRAAEVDKMSRADTRLLGGDSAAWAEMLGWSVLQTRQRLLVIDRVR